MAMEKGSWSADATSVIGAPIIAANADDRGSVIIQLTAGDPTSLAFGEIAVFGEGLQLVNVGDWIRVPGHLGRLAVYGICDGGNSSSGGYQEN